MRKTAAALVCIIVVISVAFIPFVSADWSMFRSDPSHSGVGTDNPTGNPVLTPTQLWKTNISWALNETEVQIKKRGLTEPVVVNNVVYVGANSFVQVSQYRLYWWTDVYAFNATNGSQNWAYRVDSSQISSLAFANGVVYFGSDDNKVYALNASTGILLWNATIANIGRSSPAVVDDVVYIGGYNGMIYALNAANGDVIWNVTVGSNVAWSSPAITNGMVYVGSFDGMYAVNALTGDKIWNYLADDFHGACSAAKGVVYTISSGANIYALDASNGDKIWNYSISDGWGASDPSFAIMNDVVYSRNGKGDLFALNAINGAKIWNFTFGYDISAPTVVNDVIYLGAYNGLYALNSHSGEIPWNYTKSDGFGSLSVSPVVVNGVAYVGGDFYGGEDNQLYAIAVPSPPPTPFPVVLIAAAVTVVTVGVACVALLVYFKKHYH